MPLFAVLTQQAPVGISGDEFRLRLPAGVAYLKELIRRGVIRHAWARVGESGGLTIFDVRSHEELLDALYANPISAHLSFRVYPLASVAEFSGEFGTGATTEGGPVDSDAS